MSLHFRGDIRNRDSESRASLHQSVNVRVAMQGDAMCVVRGQKGCSETCFKG